MNIQTESTEDKIISATFRLIRKDGIDKVTTKKIAAEAGVNEVTIFRKFNNKAESGRYYQRSLYGIVFKQNGRNIQL